MFAAHFSVRALTPFAVVLAFSSSHKMDTSAAGKGNGKEFVSHAPGYWPNVAPELWNDWKWQLKNRVTTLATLEQHIELSDEERSGVLRSEEQTSELQPRFG